MTIRNQLLNVESNKDRDTIAQNIGTDANKFDILINLTLTENPRFVTRIFLCVNRVLDKHPNMILPYLEVMIRQLEGDKVHIAYKRNIMRSFKDIEIPEAFEGRVLDLAMVYLYDINEAIAVKIFSMQVAFNLSKGYPELLNELKLIITELLIHANPGVLNRGRKIVRKIEMLLNKKT